MIVRRAGDVIPEVVGAVLEKRPPTRARVRHAHSLSGLRLGHRAAGGRTIARCTGGLFCGAQRKQTLHAASRKALDIEGWVKNWWTSWSTAAA